MTGVHDFGTTASAAITILVDNRADLLLRSKEHVKYFTEKPLLAEHGFAALVDLPDSGIRLLWDAGVSRRTLIQNAQSMSIDLSSIQRAHS